MDPSISLSKLSPPFSLSRQLSRRPQPPRFSPIFPRKPPSISHRPNLAIAAAVPLSNDDFVLEDVPHLTNFLPDLPSYPNPLQKSQAYSIVKRTFVSPDDVVAENVVIQKESPRGVHFRRAGPREKVYFMPEEVRACVVTCGGLCPGINTVIREIVCGLNNMYGVQDILGIEGGYKGFYSKNTMILNPKVVGDIHKRGGTFLCTSRGGHDTHKIVDNIEDRKINQEVKKRGLQVAVAGIPKTIDNDIAVIDKSFGFDTAVEEAQRAINAAHVEVESVENGVGIVKLMGRYSAEGAGQEYVAAEMHATDKKDASGNKLLLDVGPWLSDKIKVGDLTVSLNDHFTMFRKVPVNMKYIDPTYMIRAIPSNASDNIYCTLLAHGAVHGAMAGYTGFTVGPVNSKQAYIPIASTPNI
ncbi:hypothetical protein Fmac_024056 [Flemingia macrophylla]|uniref:Phosphofructokinase domain-containing protein n=1 Tax=Flemingia macrophylla TaxID=520843 RepID=A0ABD1LNE8_9FABA